MGRHVLVSMSSLLFLLLAACGPSATSTPSPKATSPALTPTRAPVSQVTPTSVPTRVPAATVAGVRPRTGGTIKMAYDREPRAWDPFKIGTADLHPWVQWSYGRLARFSAGAGCNDYPLVPELAESWRWLDDVTLEIKLREGIRFPSAGPMKGREFVADDVAYTVNVQWPRSPRTYSDWVDKATASGRHTVTIRMKKPSAVLANTVAAGWWNLITAPEVFGQSTEIQRAEENVGLGPYMLKQYVPGIRVDYERNPNYWQKGLPYIDAINFLIIPDMSTQRSALRSGRIDGVPHAQPEPSLQVELSQVQGLNVYSCPWGPYFALIATREQGSPYVDARVRQAMSMALDRDALNKTVYLGLGQAFYPFVPSPHGPASLPVDKLAPELRRYWEYRPEEAKRLLAEAGYPQGFTGTMKVTNRYGHLHTALAEGIVGMLQRIGIRLDLESLEYGRYAETVIAGKYSGAALAYIGQTSAVDALYGSFHTNGANNYSKVNDAKLDAFIEQFMALTDPDKSSAMAHEAQRLLTSQMYAIPMPGIPFAGYFASSVKNVNYKSHYMGAVDYMLYAWLDR